MLLRHAGGAWRGNRHGDRLRMDGDSCCGMLARQSPWGPQVRELVRAHGLAWLIAFMAMGP